MKFFENMFDPFTNADGPPPDTFRAFIRWMYKGTGTAIIWQTVFSVLVGLSEVISAWVVGVIINRIATVGRDTFFDGFTLTLILIVLFVLIIRPLLMSAMAGVNAMALGPGLAPVGLWRLHQYTMGQSLSFFEEDFAGRINQKQMQTAGDLGEIIMELLNAVTFAGSILIGGMIILATSDIRLSGALFFWFGLYIFAMRWALPRLRILARSRASARSAISGQFVDSISNITTVKLFAYANRETEAARQTLAHFRKAALAFGRMSALYRSINAFLSGLLPVLLIGMAVTLWYYEKTGVGIIATSAILAARMGAMSGWFSFAMMGMFADVGTVEDGIDTLAKPYTLVDSDTATPPKTVIGEICFSDVHYHYGRKDGGGLNGFDLTIKPGEKVALVGRSGAGKSTILSLLLRLRDVEGGAIMLDGQDIRTLTQDGLRAEIGMVTQDTQMFNRSTRENILYGRPDAGEDDLMRACEQAQAMEFIHDLSDSKDRKGFDARLGERGVKLSGGQRQRIALARVILKDAPILALDEATSALDSEVEAAIQDTLDGLMQDKTVIAIAHRLSTIAKMDRIVVLDAGKVIEQGTHSELLAADGLYASFWNRQSGGFIGTKNI